MAFWVKLGGGVSYNVLCFTALQAHFFLNIFQYISMDIEIGGVMLTPPPYFVPPSMGKPGRK